MTVHAIKSPSSADGWMSCAWFEKSSGSSPAADNGTAQHEVAAWSLLNNQDTDQYPHSFVDVHGVQIEVDAQMREYGGMYVGEVRRRRAEAGPGATLRVETGVDISFLTGEEGAQGTIDACIIAPVEGEPDVVDLQIIDLKSGQKRVSADCLQLRMYATAMVDELSLTKTIRNITCVIVMSRMDWVDEYTYTLDDIEAFKPQVQIAVDAYNLKVTPPTPSKAGCMWCAKRAVCPELDKFVEDAMEVEFENLEAAPVVASDGTDLATKYAKLDLVRMWCDAVESKVKEAVKAGDASLGLKLVYGRNSARKYADKAEVMALFKKWTKSGGKYPKYDVLFKTELATPAQVQKAIEKKHPKHWQKVKEMLAPGTKAIQIAPMNDPRESVVVEAQFEDLEQDN